MDQLNQILLIDDDEPTNYINELVINETDCARDVAAVESAEKALDFLRDKQNTGEPLPDCIFLDINMPAMNGWEFINEYKKLLTTDQQNAIVLVMLTTSVNPDDEEKASTIPQIDSFRIKPLSEEVLREIMDEFFTYEA